MKVYLDSLACEQRQLEEQKIRNYLTVNGVQITDTPAKSDISIFIACAVDAPSRDASLSKIEEIASNLGAKGKLIIGGCLPSINPLTVAQYNPILTFSPINLEALDDIFKPKILIAQINEVNRTKSDFSVREESLVTARDEYDCAKKGFKIKINEGCLLNCSYCVIKKATGHLISKPAKQILTEFEIAKNDEEPTVMLMGGDTGSYGYDQDIRLSGLLKKMVHPSKTPKIFIHDFNINWLIKDFKDYQDLFKLNEKKRNLCAINFPIQSGSDKILNLMKRPYSSNSIKDVLNNLNEVNPSLYLGTHMIVGFPGETERNFDESVELLQDIPLDFITCFPYSEMPGAKSCYLPEKVSKLEKDYRLNQLVSIFGEKVRVIS